MTLSVAEGLFALIGFDERALLVRQGILQANQRTVLYSGLIPSRFNYDIETDGDNRENGHARNRQDYQFLHLNLDKLDNFSGEDYTLLVKKTTRRRGLTGA